MRELRAVFVRRAAYPGQLNCAKALRLKREHMTSGQDVCGTVFGVFHFTLYLLALEVCRPQASVFFYGSG